MDTAVKIWYSSGSTCIKKGTLRKIWDELDSKQTKITLGEKEHYATSLQVVLNSRALHPSLSSHLHLSQLLLLLPLLESAKGLQLLLSLSVLQLLSFLRASLTLLLPLQLLQP